MRRNGYRLRPKVSPAIRPADAAGAPASPEEEFASSHAQPFVEAAALESAALEVVGVQRCRILRRADDPLPYRVRVVVEGSRRLAVAKDIQSAWFALWGLYVARSAFVVTALRNVSDLKEEGRSLQFVQCIATRSGATAQASVTLSAAGRAFEGHARQPASDADAMKLAAHAALEAVRAADPRRCPGDVVEMRRLRVAGSLAILCAMDDGRGRLLFGVSLVQDDERAAAVRAVLDAAQRIVPER